MEEPAVEVHTVTLKADTAHAPVGHIFKAHSAAVEVDQTQVNRIWITAQEDALAPPPLIPIAMWFALKPQLSILYQECIKNYGYPVGALTQPPIDTSLQTPLQLRSKTHSSKNPWLHPKTHWGFTPKPIRALPQTLGFNPKRLFWQ